MKRFVAIAVTPWLALVASAALNPATAKAGEPPPPVVAPIPNGLSWREVTPMERATILEFLMTQTRGNYERIRTFQATYGIVNENYMSAEQVKAGYGSRLPKGDAPR